MPPPDYRCRGRLPNGRRCEAAVLKNSIYCVFHHPETQRRRASLMIRIPYEFPEEVQRLLGEVVEAVKRKKLSPRAGNTIGYLASLLVQNQERVTKGKAEVEDAQPNAEMQAVINDWLWKRGERREKERGKEERE